MSHNITIEGGTSKRLKVAGKYCDQDIIITATGKNPVLQSKSVTPTETAQTVTPDTGYDGLAKVDVNAIPDQYLAEAEVTAQDTLIADILTALEGKAAGGGSGGGDVNTTTITIDAVMNPMTVIAATQYENGEYKHIYGNGMEVNSTIENVVCGSLVTVFAPFRHPTVSNATELCNASYDDDTNMLRSLAIFAVNDN